MVECGGAGFVSETNFLASVGHAHLVSGTSSVFDGFLLDQSDLPAAISAMRLFLDDYQVITENPDVHFLDWDPDDYELR